MMQLLGERWRLWVSLGLFVGFLILVGWTYRFPTSAYIRSFSRSKGVPMGSSLVYNGPYQSAIQVCRRDPYCVGISKNALFYSNTLLPRGSVVYTHNRNQMSYVKDLYPTVFM